MKYRLLSKTREHKKFLVILSGIILLNFLYGFDMRFTISNILRILVNIIKF
jgi:hypothetical protein